MTRTATEGTLTDDDFRRTAERAFSGAKLALLCGSGVVSLLRDDRPDIPWPGHWDLPGGGREGDETPASCAIRETAEELGLILTEADLIWRRAYPAQRAGGPATWFFAARLPLARLEDIRFGDEGQGWRLFPVTGFLALDTAIPHLRQRLAECLAGLR